MTESEYGTREFVCEECGSSIVSTGIIDNRNVCHTCRWIVDNLNLTDEEKAVLRKKLGSNPFASHE